MKDVAAICAMIAIAIMTVGGLAFQYLEKEADIPPPPKVEAKKFRFGEQCPDGLKVEYVGNVRLPKSVVCQQAVGE